MEAKAKLKYLRIAPRKVMLVIDMIRGKSVGAALELLTFSAKRACTPVKALLLSAVANARQNGGSDIDDLFISRATVDQGPTLKRYKPRAMGRATRINKSTSHVELQLDSRF